jgi:citrate lyase subunit beta/citryl-CoA lyase
VIARSYLFAPGHNEKLLGKVFQAGADAVILDLEDAVPPQEKARARALVADVLTDHAALVRVNAAHSTDCAADLAAVAGRAAAIRIPKCESAADVAWVAERAPTVPLICAIETARGLLAAEQIAAAPGLHQLSIGGVDLQRDLHAEAGNLQTLYARTHLVVVSRAAGLAPPIDSVYPHLADDAGLRDQAQFARSLGFFGKAAIHPRQIPTLHDVFTPSKDDLDWAHAILDAFDAAHGAASRLPTGEFIDLPVATRARELIQLARRWRSHPRPTSALLEE